MMCYFAIKSKPEKKVHTFNSQFRSLNKFWPSALVKYAVIEPSSTLVFCSLELLICLVAASLWSDSLLLFLSVSLSLSLFLSLSFSFSFSLYLSFSLSLSLSRSLSLSLSLLLSLSLSLYLSKSQSPSVSLLLFAPLVPKLKVVSFSSLRA